MWWQFFREKKVNMNQRLDVSVKKKEKSNSDSENSIVSICHKN